jgi:hypothetical protein
MKRREDFLIGPKEKAVEAITAGRREEAISYLEEALNLFRDLHDRYCNHLSLTQGLLAQIKGDEWFASFTRDLIFQGYRERFGSWKDMSAEQRVQTVCTMQRSHFSEFYVEESEKAFTICIIGCNAGGRLVRDGIAKRQGAVTNSPYPWSFNKVNFPHYCAHAYFFNELWEELGINARVEWGRQYDDQGNRVDEPCKYIIDKT